MKQNVSIPVIAVGSMDYKRGFNAIKNNLADLVAFGRQSIVEPEFAKKIYENRIDDIRPCCRGNEGCVSGFENWYPMRCELNPSVGREHRFKLTKSGNPKKVVVIGGGCAGLETARVADLLGHEVVLFEKSSALGGHLIEASEPGFKDKTKEALNWLIGQVKKSGVTVHMQKEPTIADIKAESPGAVVVAVGSQYIKPAFASKDALYADVAIMQPEKISGGVVVIGGGQVGLETALLLAEDRNCSVTVLEMFEDVGGTMDGNSKAALLDRLKNSGVSLMCSHKVESISQKNVYCTCKGEEKVFNANNIVIAIGLTSDNDEVEKYSLDNLPVYKVGDCVKARNISSCFYDAWKTAFEL